MSKRLCSALYQKKFFFKMADQAMEISRPLHTTRRGAIDCRSLDKIQSIIVRDCEKSMEVKEPSNTLSAGLFQIP